MRIARLVIAVLLCAVVPLLFETHAQDAPKADFADYKTLFEEFTNRRQVVLTKLEQVYAQKTPDAEQVRKLEDELKQIDNAYCDALAKYIKAHGEAEDAQYARYELTITLARFEDRLEESVKAADEFLRAHSKSELVPAVKFARAQSLFRLAGRETDAIKALDEFIRDHSDTEEADFARMMRVRAHLFADNVEDARRALADIMKLDKVKSDAAARAYIQRQLDDLDWIGRDLPKFALPDTDNNVVSTDDLKGKPLLIFVWDSTSGVCLEEIGFVKALHDKHKDKLKVLGFSINESKPALEQWLKRNTPGFSNVWEERTKEGGFVKRLDVRNIPFNVLVDKDGKIFRYDVRSDELMRHAALLVK